MGEAIRLTDTVRDLLESGRRERLNQILEDAHAADIAAALRELSLPDQVTLFRLLGRESAGAVLAELGDQAVHELAGALDEGEISSILDRMRPDDAAQVLEELPAEQAEKVLDLMKEEKSEEVQGLLEYGEKTAGRLMTPDMLAVLEYLTVAQAIEQVRKSPVAETASVLYVVDDHDHLVGSLPWRRLITADPTAPVGLLRQEEPVSVTPETDQGEVARLVAKYNLSSTSSGRRPPRTSSASEGRPATRPSWPRPGWSSRSACENSIRELALLAVFMPIVASMGGIGTTQTATVVVRGLALGDMSAAHLGRVLREGDHPGPDHRTGQWPGHGHHRLPLEGAGPPAQELPRGPRHRLERDHHDLHRRLRVLLLPRPGHPPDPIPALVRAAKVRFTLAACKKRVAIFMPTGMQKVLKSQALRKS